MTSHKRHKTRESPKQRTSSTAVTAETQQSATTAIPDPPPTKKNKPKRCTLLWQKPLPCWRTTARRVSRSQSKARPSRSWWSPEVSPLSHRPRFRLQYTPRRVSSAALSRDEIGNEVRIRKTKEQVRTGHPTTNPELMMPASTRRLTEPTRCSSSRGQGRSRARPPPPSTAGDRSGRLWPPRERRRQDQAFLEAWESKGSGVVGLETFRATVLYIAPTPHPRTRARKWHRRSAVPE